MNRRRTVLAVAAALAVLAVPLAAAAAGSGLPATRVLAPDGDVFQITQGTYGELFPRGAEALPDDPVLALTVVHADGTSERLLVPQTAGPEAEELSSLVLGTEGDAVHVLWQGGGAGARLRLASLTGEAWGEVIEVSRAVPVLPGSPRAAVTRDRAALEAGGEASEQLDRSVLHVVWSEEAGGSVIYAPLVFEDGVYVGEHAIYGLDRLVAESAGGAVVAPAAEGAALAPAVEPGDGGSAVVAYTDPETGSLVTVLLRMVAGELSGVGDRLRDEILDLVERLEPGSPDSLRQLAGGARAQVIGVGNRLKPGLVQLLAAEIESYVLENGADWAFMPEAMAERTRRELIAIGSEFDHSSIRRTEGGARAQVIGVGRVSEGTLPSHDLSVQVTAMRTAPALPAGADGRVFLSGDGENALVAWEAEGTVFFRESDPGPEGDWGAVSSLGIAAGEEPSLIVDLLRDRVRGR